MSRTDSRLRKIVILFIMLALVLISGCQNYIGDKRQLQNAFLTGFETYSFNASSTLTIQLDLNEAALKSLSIAEQEIYRTLEEISITLADHSRK